MDTPHADNPPHFEMDVRTKVYLWLTAIVVACLLVSDMVGIKLFQLDLPGWTVKHTCGMIAFPITFMLTDLLNDYYGRKAARHVAYVAFAMGLLVFIVVNIALAMPRLPADYNVPESSFHDVFAKARIMFVASLAAFIVGSLLDIWIFGVMKRLTGGKLIWLRATGSTVVSQIFDSLVVSTLAFHFLPKWLGQDFVMPMTDALKTAATGYVLKFVLALAITPLIYAGHMVLREGFGMKPMPVSEEA